MDAQLYRENADSVFAVFEMLRRELEAEHDDSPVLGKLHEISSLGAADFFAGLETLVVNSPRETSPQHPRGLTQRAALFDVRRSPV